MSRVVRFLAALTLIAAGPALAASAPPVAAENGMVASAQRLASEVGVEVLKRGGNAVDAAVAVGYALAVVLPPDGNLGGGGFMTAVFADGRKTFIDFREKAPLAATPDMYLDKDGNVVKGLSTRGYGRRPGIRAREIWDTAPRRPARPGNFAGREWFHPRFGRSDPVRLGY